MYGYRMCVYIYTYMFTYVPPHSFGGWLVFAYLLVPTTYYYQKGQEMMIFHSYVSLAEGKLLQITRFTVGFMLMK